jgi:hypothetical protein
VGSGSPMGGLDRFGREGGWSEGRGFGVGRRFRSTGLRRSAEGGMPALGHGHAGGQNTCSAANTSPDVQKADPESEKSLCWTPGKSPNL